MARSLKQQLFEALKNKLGNSELNGPAEPVKAGDDLLRVCLQDPAVSLACEKAGLDQNNPAHLAALFGTLARVFFPSGEPGAPVVWDSFSLSHLLLQYLRARAGNPGLSREAVCEELAKLPMYRKQKAATLRRVLTTAADPDKNLLLRHVLAGLPEPLLRIGEHRGRPRPFPEWQELADHWSAIDQLSCVMPFKTTQ